MPEFIDAHCHMNFESYAQDRDEVVARALQAGVWMINVGTTRETSASAVSVARSYPQGVYAIVGMHPVQDGESSENFDYDFFKKLASDERVVAIGECGLDYFRADKNSPLKMAAQKESFEAQIMLAKELGKPLMLHIRDAYKDALEILRAHPGVRGNAHFFAGSLEDAKAFFDIGFTISFTGVITFTNDYDEIVQYAPLDMILSETDAPYVTPVPNRGKRNEPLFVRDVVHKIAQIRGQGEEIVKKAIISNAGRLFGFNFSS